MKYLYIIVVALIAYLLIEAVIFYYKFSHLLVLIVPQHRDLVIGTGYDLRYIASGDSTAVGEGASDVFKTYTNKVAEALAQNKKVYYRNVGQVGAQTADLIKNQLQQIIDFNPDIVTISIGANDATHFKSSAEILSNLNKIIAEITVNTKATIYLTDIPNFAWAKILPWFYRGLLETRDKSINKEILKLESDRVKIVDIHDFGWSRFPDPSVTNAADNFHPNDLGYQNWTDAFMAKILAK